MEKSQGVKIVKVSLERKLPLFKKTCPQCGKEFTGVKKAIYCSKLCSNKASYHRHAAEYQAGRRERYRAQKKQTTKK